jgi:hypothetical protein
LVSQSVLALVLVPVSIELMDWALGAQAHFSAGEVARVRAQAILVPPGAGMLAGRLLPRLRNAAPHLLTVGAVLLIAGAPPMLPVAWKTFGTLRGDGAMLASALFVIGGHGGRADVAIASTVRSSSAGPLPRRIFRSRPRWLPEQW